MNDNTYSRLRRFLGQLLAGCIGALFFATPAVRAQEAGAPRELDFFGLLRVRGLTPIGFLRLDILQSPATFSTSKNPSIEFDLGYQNTWTVSYDVQEFVRSRF